MKNLIFAIIVLTSVFASAQSKKTVKKTTTTTSSLNDMSLDSDSTDEVTAKGGFAAGAIHIGADYNKMTDGMGPGGYFFYQTSKKSGAATIVNQVMSLGGTYKVNLIENHKVIAYVSPGFGIHMVKDVAGGAGAPSDETLIGPVYKLGTQIKMKPTFAIGLERNAIVNWFNDKLGGGEFVYYSVAGTFWF